MRYISKFKKSSLLFALLVLTGAAFLVGSVSGGHSAALAQTPPTSPTTAPTTPTTPTVTGTEAAGQETNDGAGEPSEGAKAVEKDETSDQAALQAQTKITAEQTKVAALAKVPGTVVSASLEDENGKGVYQVIITPTAGGANQYVKVDAANGTVVVAETGDTGQEGNSEAND